MQINPAFDEAKEHYWLADVAGSKENLYDW
jgi:hypothetical protein